MKGREREYIGRVERLLNANAAVAPVAEWREGVGWQPIADVRGLFPPHGTADFLGAPLLRLREGDWLVFASTPSNRPRAPTVFKAVGGRRPSRLLAHGADADAESRRKLLVEVGLEDAGPGEWAVRVGPDAVARVALAEGPDGRWRAPGLRSPISLRRFDPDLVIDVPGIPGWEVLYDYEGAEQLAESVDWSRDDEFILAAARALANGEDGAGKIETLLRGSADALTGRLTVIGGADPSIAAELVRTNALADRMRDDAQFLARFRTALLADPTVQGIVAKAAAERSAAEIPALAAVARAEIEAEMAAARADAAAEVKAVVAEMEGEEMAALERRRAAREAEIEATIGDMHRRRLAEVEASVAESQAEKLAEGAKLNQLLRAASEGVRKLEERRAALDEGVAVLAAEESALVDRVESLARSEAALGARNPAAPSRLPAFRRDAEEKTLGLEGVSEAARSLGLLTSAGVDAVMRMAVLQAAGEIPILLGGHAADLADVAALILSGGRIAVLTGDPTTVTFEDLWTRPGGAGPTALAAAADAAEAGIPVVGVVTGAENSGARFWYPALLDARRRGHLPRGLMLCATIGEAASDEGEAILRGAFHIDTSGAFDAEAFVLAPLVFERSLAEPMSFHPEPPEIEPAAAALMLREHGEGLGPVAALRLARVHAAASKANGAAGGSAMAAAFGRCLLPRKTAAEAPNVAYLPGRSANA